MNLNLQATFLISLLCLEYLLFKQWPKQMSYWHLNHKCQEIDKISSPRNVKMMSDTFMRCNVIVMYLLLVNPFAA